MADWTELDTNGLLPGEPFTSAKALAFFENPVAMAGGAVNAPKVVSEALDMLVGAGTGTTAYTDLDRINGVLLSASAVATGTDTGGFGGGPTSRTATIGYRTSTNNGSSYGATTNLVSVFSPNGTPNSFTAFALIALGASNAIEVITGSSGGAGTTSHSFSILGVSGVSP